MKKNYLSFDEYGKEYKFLNANLLETKKGEISLKDLPSILDAQFGLHRLEMLL